MIKPSKSLDYISLNERQEYNDVYCRCIDFSVLFVVFCEHNQTTWLYLFIYFYVLVLHRFIYENVDFINKQYVSMTFTSKLTAITRTQFS